MYGRPVNVSRGENIGASAFGPSLSPVKNHRNQSYNPPILQSYQSYNSAIRRLARRTNTVRTILQGTPGNVIPRVSKEGDVGALDLLVLSPSGHNGAIVHTVHQHLVDSRGLKGSLALKVPGNLARGSRGGESAGQTNQDGLLALEALGHVHLLRREPVVDGNIGESAAHSDRHGCRWIATSVQTIATNVYIRKPLYRVVSAYRQLAYPSYNYTDDLITFVHLTTFPFAGNPNSPFRLVNLKAFKPYRVVL